MGRSSRCLNCNTQNPAIGSIDEKACVRAHKFALLAYETGVTGGSGVGCIVTDKSELVYLM